MTAFSDRSVNVAMVTDFVAKSVKLAYPTFINRIGIMAFQNGLEHRNSDVKRLNGDDPSTFGRNLVSFLYSNPRVYETRLFLALFHYCSIDASTTRPAGLLTRLCRRNINFRILTFHYSFLQYLKTSFETNSLH